MKFLEGVLIYLVSFWKTVFDHTEFILSKNIVTALYETPTSIEDGCRSLDEEKLYLDDNSFLGQLNFVVECVWTYHGDSYRG